MADKFNLIGVVRGINNTTTKASDAHPDGRPKLEVEIEDMVGAKAKWGTFHVSIAKDLQVGKWYEFEVATPPRQGEGRSGVWNNLESVVRGPMPKPEAGTQGGEAAMAATGPSHTVKSDAQFKIERTSLQRQGAMGIVLRLMELGITLPQMAETLDEVLKHATTVEAFYERDIEQPAPTTKKRQRKEPEQVKLATEAASKPEDRTDEAKEAEVEAMGTDRAKPERVPAFANVGELMMKVTGQFKGKTSGDLCALLEVKRPVDIEKLDLDAAYAKAQEAWGEAA